MFYRLPNFCRYANSTHDLIFTTLLNFFFGRNSLHLLRCLDSKRKGLALGSRRLLAILRKRFLYSRRNAMQLVTQLVVPLLILGLVAALSRMNLSFSGEDMSECEAYFLRPFGSTSSCDSHILLGIPVMTVSCL